MPGATMDQWHHRHHFLAGLRGDHVGIGPDCLEEAHQPLVVGEVDVPDGAHRGHQLLGGGIGGEGESGRLEQRQRPRRGGRSTAASMAPRQP